MTAAAITAGQPPAKAREPFDRRTFQKVRRDSPEAGGAWEADWTRVQDEKALGNVTRAVRAYLKHRRELQAQQKGRYRPLPLYAKEILDLIVRAKTTTGVFTMEALQIAQEVGCSVSSVYAHLKLLKNLGIIEWSRRSERTGERGTRGEGYRQTSNIYRLRELPKHIAEMFRGFARRPMPTPEEAAAAARQAAEIQRLDDRRRTDAWSRMKAASPAVAAAEAKAKAQERAEFFSQSALGRLLTKPTPT